MRKYSLFSLVALAVTLAPLMGAGTALAQGEPKPNEFWWPDRLNLAPPPQHTGATDP